MTEVEKLRRGDVYRHVMSGGGGFGDPLEREPARVLEDVLDGKVTPGHAERAYGIVITLGGAGPTLDRAATTARRAGWLAAKQG